MAKKKIDHPFEVSLRFISDPGHGWAEVPTVICRALELDDDYTRRGSWCYLEEDCECHDLEEAAKRHGMVIHFTEVEVDDFDAWLDGKQWPDARAPQPAEDELCQLNLPALRFSCRMMDAIKGMRKSLILSLQHLGMEWQDYPAWHLVDDIIVEFGDDPDATEPVRSRDPGN